LAELQRALHEQARWTLHITKRRQRTFKVVGLTWIVERTFAWLSQKSSLEQRLRVERVQTSEAFIDLTRPNKAPQRHPING
jgi:hypothetical protein